MEIIFLFVLRFYNYHVLYCTRCSLCPRIQIAQSDWSVSGRLFSYCPETSQYYPENPESNCFQGRQEKQMALSGQVRNATFSLGGSERPREDVNDGLTSILTFDKPSSVRDGLERRSSGFFSHTSYHGFCRSVRSGRATAASLLALPYCATSREAEVGSPRPNDSRISSERVRRPPRFLSCVCF